MPKVLIVDDVMENLYLLQLLLAGHGYEAVSARNGVEALDQARRFPPDLIISDILMPVMDGFTLCRQWKMDPRLREIPFVFYTATYTDPKDEQLAMSLGADLFVVKPTEPDAFLAMVGSVLSKFQTQGGRVAATAPPMEDAYLKEHNEALIRKLEDKLVELEETNKNLAIKSDAIESSISGIALADLSGKITYVNDAFAAMWGRTRAALSGVYARDLVHDANTLASIGATFKQIGSWSGEIEAERSDGSALFAQVAVHTVRDRLGQPVCLMASCIDITERRRMRDGLQRAEKLESLAVLAGGIAHDFNNLLTGLYGNIELAKMELPSDSPANEFLDEVRRTFERAKDLTQQLLTYAKGSRLAVSEVRVDERLRECCLLSFSGSNIRYKFEVDDDLWPAMADPNQISQVFTNVLINARQAMTDGGEVSIAVENRSLLPGEIAQLPAGKYVRISVRDSGVGIPKEVISKIFDPFFTTKPQGSGLGLAISFGIIKKHGGHIEVESTPGVGSTFTIWLPAFSGQTTQLPREAAHERFHGDGRILVMDDEKAVRDVAKHMLQMGGYEVELVSGGEEALAAYQQASLSGKPFDAVILDLTIRGGLGGRETAAALHKLDADAAIIISSGYASDPGFSKLREIGFITTVPKPYLLHELLCSVKGVIAKKRRDPKNPKEANTSL